MGQASATSMYTLNARRALMRVSEAAAALQVLVIDGTGGLVTGAIAERMGGHGIIAVAHAGSRADPSDLVEKFNLPTGAKQIIRRLHIQALLDLLPGRNSATAPA